MYFCEVMGKIWANESNSQIEPLGHNIFKIYSVMPSKNIIIWVYFVSCIQFLVYWEKRPQFYFWNSFFFGNGHFLSRMKTLHCYLHLHAETMTENIALLPALARRNNDRKHCIATCTCVQKQWQKTLHCYLHLHSETMTENIALLPALACRNNVQ